MSVTYTDPALLTGAARAGVAPNYGRNASGYGPKIPTAVTVVYAGRRRRVYVVQYANAGSAYIVVGGVDRYLDISTEYTLADLAPGDVVAREYTGDLRPDLPAGMAYVLRDRAGAMMGTGGTVSDAVSAATRRREQVIR